MVSSLRLLGCSRIPDSREREEFRKSRVPTSYLWDLTRLVTDSEQALILLDSASLSEHNCAHSLLQKSSSNRGGWKCRLLEATNLRTFYNYQDSPPRDNDHVSGAVKTQRWIISAESAHDI